MSTRLQDSIANKEFVITAEIVPPLSGGASSLLDEAAQLRGGVDAINITDAAAGRTAMSSFAATALLAQNGFQPILQVTCRDRNRIALAGDLLGASAQGVHNVLVLRGDDPSFGDQPDAKPVFDMESSELMTLARDMRDTGRLPSGRKIEPPPEFFIGGADVPRMPDAKWESKWLLAKADAGAGFIQTQFCFDLDVARAYIGRLQEDGITGRLGVIIGVGPIRSAKSARWMNDNLFGVHVPDETIKRLESAADPRAEGRRICVELIRGLRKINGVAGAHIMAPAQGTDAIAQVLETL
ncbi:methylenetetrahydrofolate reductase [Candidatus Rariloculus sp.]|uniref:methylenetetrahydrofolate reductase n=1 Tax=Candidatus Rariloculus sp. TaxID=3101265 RepID=UPI003D11B180